MLLLEPEQKNFLKSLKNYKFKVTDALHSNLSLYLNLIFC